MAYIYNVIIGDGSQYQKPGPPSPGFPSSPDDLKKWRQWNDDKLIGGSTGTLGKAKAWVFWYDGEMYVRLDCASTPDASVENPQPDIALVIDIHEWESLISNAASKRRELEGRTLFGADQDDMAIKL